MCYSIHSAIARLYEKVSTAGFGDRLFRRVGEHQQRLIGGAS
jgi:hypothetical protein